MMEETLDLEAGFEEPSRYNADLTDFGETVISPNLDATKEKSYATIEPEELHIETNDDQQSFDYNDESLEEETKDLIQYQEGMLLFETDVGCLAPIPISDKYKEFSVKEPMKHGTYITYQVQGFISEPFTCPKRFSDFEWLRECLLEKWIGFFIPAIPPKQAIGNMDKYFIIERKQQLNSFIKQLAKYQFLVESSEFLAFTQLTGEKLAQQKKMTAKEGPLIKLQKYQQVCPIDLQHFNEEQKAKCKLSIEKFLRYIDQCLTSMKARKNTHMDLAQRMENQNQNYMQLIAKLQEYEQSGLGYYDPQSKGLILESKVFEQDHNPYKLMYSWILSEIQDLLAMQQSINGLRKIETKIVELRTEVQETRQFLQATQQNKTTIKGIWLFVTRREMTETEIQAAIDRLEAEIDEWCSLHSYLTVYIPMVAIPRFKTDRGGQYFHFLANFATTHIKACDRNIEQWKSVIDATQNLDDGLF